MEKLEQEFDAALAALCELHGKELSVAFYRFYKQAILTKLSLEEAIQAITLAFSSKTYGFPKPADLIELIKPAQSEAGALEAWEALEQTIRCKGAYSSVVFIDARISRVVVAMGGWLEVCKWRTDEMHFRRQEFMKLFKATGPADQYDQQVLPGLVELDNRARGFYDDLPPAEIIGDPDKLRLALPQTKRQKLVEHCINTLLVGTHSEKAKEATVAKSARVKEEQA